MDASGDSTAVVIPNTNLATAIVPNDVHIRSPMAIMALPNSEPPTNLCFTFDTELPKPVSCYPITITSVPEPPSIEEPRCCAGYAVAYVDVNFTSHILQINAEGDALSPPRRVSRINAQTDRGERHEIPSIFIVPGSYPGCMTTIAISALHGNAVLLTASLVAPRVVVNNAARTSVLLDTALEQHSFRYEAFLESRHKLLDSQKALATSTKYIRSAAERDYYGIRYLIAAAELQGARLVVGRALTDAINDYNVMVLSDPVTHIRPVKTEVRILDQAGEPVFQSDVMGGPALPNN